MARRPHAGPLSAADTVPRNAVLRPSFNLALAAIDVAKRPWPPPGGPQPRERLSVSHN